MSELVSTLRTTAAVAPDALSVTRLLPAARELLRAAANEIERLSKVEAAARNVADTLNGGFIRCETCGDQETTTDVDFAAELYAALGVEKKP